jgi:hypothetical protein
MRLSPLWASGLAAVLIAGIFAIPNCGGGRESTTFYQLRPNGDLVFLKDTDGIQTLRMIDLGARHVTCLIPAEHGGLPESSVNFVWIKLGRQPFIYAALISGKQALAFAVVTVSAVIATMYFVARAMLRRKGYSKA